MKVQAMMRGITSCSIGEIPEMPGFKFLLAAALGVSPGQITNSLVFELKPMGGGERRPVLVCSPGDRRVDPKKLAALLGVSKSKVKSASGGSVLAYTGMEPGGVGPCGFQGSPPFYAAFVEARCFLGGQASEVWCGAGVKRGMMRCSPEELLGR